MVKVYLPPEYQTGYFDFFLFYSNYLLPALPPHDDVCQGGSPTLFLLFFFLLFLVLCVVVCTALPVSATVSGAWSCRREEIWFVPCVYAPPMRCIAGVGAAPGYFLTFFPKFFFSFRIILDFLTFFFFPDLFHSSADNMVGNAQFRRS